MIILSTRITPPRAGFGKDLHAGKQAARMQNARFFANLNKKTRLTTLPVFRIRISRYPN
jgi:hypothetical protein